MKLPSKIINLAFIGCLTSSVYAQTNQGVDMEDPMDLWRSCTKVKIMSKTDWCGDNQECLKDDSINADAMIYTKSGETYTWKGLTYNVFSESGETLAGGSEIDLTGTFEEGVDEWAIENSVSRPDNVTDISLIFLPIAEGKYIINQVVLDCLNP